MSRLAEPGHPLLPLGPAGGAGGIRLTLLAALCSLRTAEIIDGLIELFVGLVHRIDARAERQVEGELINDLRRVRGKKALLFALPRPLLANPDQTVRDVLFPVASEGPLRTW